MLERRTSDRVDNLDIVSPGPAAASEVLSIGVYERLRHDIIVGRYLPGMWLTEREIVPSSTRLGQHRHTVGA